MTFVFLGISIGFILLERLIPWRTSQPFARKGLFTDVLFVLFNAYLFYRFLYGPLASSVKTHFASLMTTAGIADYLEAGIFQNQPMWLQFVCLFFLQDFLKWGIHNLLHRVPLLWEFHKVHHSIEIMDWFGNMRFHWFEIVVYNMLLFLPLSYLGFASRLFFWTGIIEILIGHFNHSNVRLNIRWFGYFLNSPRMHIWHHAADDPGAINKNFGIVLSLWDWLFGTAYMPAGRVPQKLGFAGMENYPSGFFSQYTFPLSLLRRKMGVQHA